MNDRQKVEARAAEQVLPAMSETEKNVILSAETVIQGKAIKATDTDLEHLVKLGLVLPARNIGGYPCPPVLTLLGSQVHRHLRYITGRDTA